ncbi:NACHT domain-containing protein [Burkholderia ubonensis]|uniref:NACHT domain-containing protein n=1 Tax=Burkholderia ubonensis TaxID=101571 RepID=UPI000A8D1937|nr:hypothetical protein [Burkholderia ubonensis]
MTESGGPTTQSGIYYQNSIAALYLGALLDLRAPNNGTTRITSVRVEAPEDIDDIVVTYADGSTLYIQAKEQLALHGDAWAKFWESVRKQAAKCRSARDEFRLVLGTLGAALENLRETLDRAQGKDDIAEWRDALNENQKKIATSILKALALPDDDAFSAIKRTRAEFITLNSSETTGARDWMPYASEPPSALHSRLRDCCGGAARIRHTFRAGELSEALLRRFNVRIFGSQGDGLERYRSAIAGQFDHIGVPGTAISVPEDDLFTWPTIVSVDKAAQGDFEDEDPWRYHRQIGDQIDLRDFPSLETSAIVLESGAGYGKSTVLRATVRRLATTTAFVPAFIHAEALPEHSTIQDYLNTEYNSGYQVAIDWTTLCEQGRAVMFIDGVDELNDSARAALVNMIGRAVARFPDMPILIGARDASMTTFPPRFKLFRVLRLDDEQMSSMLQAYVSTRGEFDVKTVVRHVHTYEELELLCRIPLFLAIFVATLPKSGPIPTSRTEVLELYILHALSPERHKGVEKSAIGKTQLRRGAEAIASLSLERNEAAVAETKMRACLSEVLGDPTGDDCVDTLVKHGLLERRGPRLAFCIPTVQEYLAGCVLAESGRLDANDWLENVYRRPWAQALQFAVEKIDNADFLLSRLIEREDDLFYTALRLAARCIVNGASVSAALKNAVASRLAHAWAKVGYRTSVRIGALVVDGFCRPIHSDIRKVLTNGRLHLNQRPAILARAADNALTLECLQSVLENEDIRDLWDPQWHRAMEPVMSEAIALLLDRARQEDKGTQAANIIAEILFQLRGKSEIDWKIISCDVGLPLVVRSAAHFSLPEGAGGPEPELIEAAFRDSEESDLWRSFHQAYMSTSWWRRHFIDLCRSDADEGRGEIFDYLCGDGEATQALIDFFIEIVKDPLTNSRHRFKLQIILGSLAITEFADAATDALANADIDLINIWISGASHFPEETIHRGVASILSRNLLTRECIDIIDRLYHVTAWKPDGPRRSLGNELTIIRRNVPNEMTTMLVARAEQLIEDGNASAAQIRSLVHLCGQYGSERATYQLISDLQVYLDSHSVIDRTDWNWFAGAVHTIYENGFELDTDRLWQIIKKGQTLPLYFIVDRLIEKERENCYPQLIEYVNKNLKSTAMHAVYNYFEQNAEREGLNVRITGGKLQISKV